MEDMNWKMLIMPIAILFIFVGGIIGIVNWEKSKNAPVESISVDLNEGLNQSTQKDITVNGKVKTGDKVFVNGQEVKVGKDGSYSKTVTLNEGDNKITIKDQRNGKDVQTLERTVTFTPQPASQPAAGGQQQQGMGGGQPQTSQPAPSQSQPQAQTPSNLSTSGPADIAIPVVGFAGVILTAAYYFKSKKKLSMTLKK